jgi:biotin transport system substrate-specific component
MGGILGVRSGLINIFALYLATVVGLPLMSGFGGGLQVFARPTTGFIVGFAFVVLMAGICHDIFAHRVNAKLFSVLFMLFSFIGVLICYGFGSAWLVIYNHTGFIAFGTVFKANLAFLPFDAVKCIVASAIATSFAFVPSLKKLAKSH